MNYFHCFLKQLTGYLIHPSIELSNQKLQIADMGTQTAWGSLSCRHPVIAYIIHQNMGHRSCWIIRSACRSCRLRYLWSIYPFCCVVAFQSQDSHTWYHCTLLQRLARTIWCHQLPFISYSATRKAQRYVGERHDTVEYVFIMFVCRHGSLNVIRTRWIHSVDRARQDRARASQYQL